MFLKNDPMTEEQIANQKRVLRQGNGKDCIIFALYNKNADIRALEERLLIVGSQNDCLVFSEHIEGANKTALINRYNEIMNTDF